MLSPKSQMKENGMAVRTEIAEMIFGRLTWTTDPFEFVIIVNDLRVFYGTWDELTMWLRDNPRYIVY